MSLYSPPRNVTDFSTCYFYHSMTLGSYGEVQGDWDLRPNLREYLGNVDFRGKRVLDVGCASGALSFFMERNGGEIVSFDMDERGEWDMVPFAKWKEMEAIANQRHEIIGRLNNSYWFAHRVLGSKARVVYGNVYSMPTEIGAVDISVFGSILLHLRDPFLALQNGLRLTKDIVVVAESLRGQPVRTTEPYLGFLPNASTIEPKDAWWDVRPEWVVRAVGVLGFEDCSVTLHSQKFQGRDIETYTVVARRTSGNSVAS